MFSGLRSRWTRSSAWTALSALRIDSPRRPSSSIGMPFSSSRQPVGQQRHRDELHHQTRPPVLQLQRVVERGRVDAAQLAQRRALQLEAHDRVRVGHRDLDRRLAAVGHRRQVDGAEPAAPEQLVDRQAFDVTAARSGGGASSAGFGSRGATSMPHAGVHGAPAPAARGASGPRELHHVTLPSAEARENVGWHRETAGSREAGRPSKVSARCGYQVPKEA